MEPREDKSNQAGDGKLEPIGDEKAPVVKGWEVGVKGGVEIFMLMLIRRRIGRRRSIGRRRFC